MQSSGNAHVGLKVVDGSLYKYKWYALFRVEAGKQCGGQCPGKIK